MRSKLRPMFLIAIIIGSIILVIAGFLFIPWPTKSEKKIDFGMTISRPYASEALHVDPDAVLTAALDDLKIRRFRLPAYWNLLEPTQGTWTFDDLDRDISAIGERGGTVLLAIGRKLPRWPECWEPDWEKPLPKNERDQALFRYLETVVTRYRNNPTIVGWEVENEPHFDYGECPKPDLALLFKETELVKKLDPSRPVVTTDSGELSLWVTFGTSIDRLGVSVYRVVRNPILGTWRYWFIPPYFYARKALLVKSFGVKNVYVSEFQMEPWSNAALIETPIEDQFKTMNIEQMRKNFRFAERMGLSPIDFWGVEWWYWMKERQNHPEFWEEAKAFYTRRP